MKKIAVIKIDNNEIKLTLANILPSETFVVFDQMIEKINIMENVYRSKMFDGNNIANTMKILSSMKALIDSYQVNDVITVCVEELKIAKNYKSFIDEIYSETGYAVKNFSIEEQLKALYVSTINSIDCPKSLIINISTNNTKLYLFNRRNIINKHILEIGESNVSELLENVDYDSSEEKMDILIKEISKRFDEVPWINEVTHEFKIVGIGRAFNNLAKLDQKIRKYPLNIVHGYELNLKSSNRVYNFIKDKNFDKNIKIPEIGNERAEVLLNSACIVKSIMDKFYVEPVNTDEEIIEERVIIVSQNEINEGLLYNYATPKTVDKTITDILGYSLATINDYYGEDTNNAEHVYNLSMILYKELRVLHKLSKSHLKALRAASSLYCSGTRINYYNNVKNSFSVITGSSIAGLNHRELVMAGFIASSQYLSNISSMDIIRYKDLLNSKEELAAIKKLAVIVRLASDLDRFKQKRVIDLNCDILGDTVIMKTVVDKKADFEVMFARRAADDFKKAFKKSLEIL